MIARLPRPHRLLRRLRRDRSGLALMEFAFTLPIVLGIGGYGIEVANLALLNLRISQIALALADNASRVGTSGLSQQQLREVDINDIFQGARVQGNSIGLPTYGRVILSSLENVAQSYDTSGPVQRIHWQRCFGLKSDPAYVSSYGTTSPTAGTDASQGNAGTPAPTGMGDPGTPKVMAPSGAGVMFVEINFQTRPVFGSLFMNGARIHYIASFIVRDNRNFSQVWNPTTTPATVASTCDKYTT